LTSYIYSFVFGLTSLSVGFAEPSAALDLLVDGESEFPSGGGGGLRTAVGVVVDSVEDFCGDIGKDGVVVLFTILVFFFQSSLRERRSSMMVSVRPFVSNSDSGFLDLWFVLF